MIVSGTANQCSLSFYLLEQFLVFSAIARWTLAHIRPDTSLEAMYIGFLHYGTKTAGRLGPQIWMNYDFC